MPQRPTFVPCPTCGQPRRRGGSITPETVCRKCKKKPKVDYVCVVTGCGSKVSGPDRHCPKCNGARMRKRPERQFITEKVAERQAHDPECSWWVARPRDRWSDDIAVQMPRFRAAGIGKDRPPIGMSLTTY